MKKIPRRATVGISIALLTGCLILINLLVSRLHLRFDLSQGKVYSLSKGSKRVLKDLPGPIELRFYVSRELPQAEAARRAYVEDLLAEYKEAGSGKIQVTVRNASLNQWRDAGIADGVVPIEFNIVSKEKFQIARGMLGIVIHYGEKTEALPYIADAKTLEFDLTSRILQLTRKRRRVVGLIASHGAIGPEQLSPRARAHLQRHYDLLTIDLKELAPGALLDKSIEALMVLGPTRRLEDYHLYTLEQFLISGRPLTVAIDMRQTDLRQFMARSVTNGLPKLLAHWGVRPINNLVLDRQNQPVQVARRQGFITFTNVVPFPPNVIATDLNPEHPVTRHLDSLLLPFVSPLNISTTGVHATVLARSSAGSWLKAPWGRAAVHSISPMQKLSATADDPEGPFTLAAALTGPFTSFFSGKQLPGEALRKTFQEISSEDSRLLVVGSAGFARADMGEAGTALLLNTVDWMLLDEDLSWMRAKGFRLRPLRDISDSAKFQIRWAGVFGPLLLIAGVGLLRLRWRRNTRQRRDREWAPRHASK
jgi:ABC-2 type transport system permease protein